MVQCGSKAVLRGSKVYGCGSALMEHPLAAVENEQEVAEETAVVETRRPAGL